VSLRAFLYDVGDGFAANFGAVAIVPTRHGSSTPAGRVRQRDAPPVPRSPIPEHKEQTPMRVPTCLAIPLITAASWGIATPTIEAGSLAVPVQYTKLDNGLKVVLSPDPTAATAVVAVYYNIGFRIEPKDRTGFAHLFEHMMFQGSANLGKMEFIKLVQSNGGILNGSTRFDFTNYFQIVPPHTVETVLWAEADRMRSLAITQDNLTNQQGVVKNEVKVNVLNQPYGGFPWIDMPQVANTNWYNAHNFYGDLEDLDAATLDDVRRFFETYYAPYNSVVVVTGNVDAAQALGWIRKYFGPIKLVAQPAKPDIAEPPQKEERRASKSYPQAPRPALAVAYHVPARSSPEYYAMGLIDQILLQGDDSRLHEALVRKGGHTGGISGGINFPLGSMFDINGPTLWMSSLFHDRGRSADEILTAFDAEIEALRTTPVDQATLDLAKVKMRSRLYGQIEQFSGMGLANLLACFALFDDDPGLVNRLEDEFDKVTPALIQRTADQYLRRTNRTVLTVEPKPETSAPAGEMR
jgi:predicted Zn-dependent peptidase